MPGPLVGLRIVDLTNTFMGPFATQVLGDMGASIVKVEPPEGDPVRQLGPGRSPGMGAIFLQANRGKRSVVLDLKREGGRDALLRIAAGSDLFVYNMRPHVMKRLRLAYEDVAAAAPSIVYAGLFGFGQDGPNAARPAYDDLIQGMTALPSLAAAAGATPRYVPLAFADRVVGFYGASAMMSAIWHRERTGQGQRLDIPMFETMAGLILADHMGGRLFDPPEGPIGYRRLLSKDRRPYATQDGHVCAMIYNDGQWRRFFDAIGRPDIWNSDPRFRTLSSRTRHVDEIYGWVADYMRERSTADCMTILEKADIPHGPLNTVDELIDDEHLRAKGFFVPVDHPSEGRLAMPGVPAAFSATPSTIGGPAPRLGEHSRDVLRETGLDAAAIDALFYDGIAAEPA